MPSLVSHPPRVCIYGAGAIGLDLGVALLRAGVTLALVARGQTLAALRSRGIQAKHPDADTLEQFASDRFRCAEHPAELGEQDLVFLCVKSGSTWAAAAELAPLLGPHTTVVTTMNGLPPWYASGRPGIERHLADTRERDAFFCMVARERIIGAVINRNAACPAPGIVQRNAGEGLVLGELDNQRSARLAGLEELLGSGDYTLRPSTDIHRELWHKLLINASLNPISVVCERSLSEMVTDPSIRARLQGIIEELHGLGVALELTTPGSFNVQTFFERFRTGRRGAYTSMLRDYQRGRPLELDRIVRAPLWLAARPGLSYPMPRLRAALQEVEAKAGALATASVSASL